MPDSSAAIDVRLQAHGMTFRVQVQVPTASVPLSHMVPLVQGLADAVMGVGIQAVESRGESHSCRIGCAACCRSLIAITDAEADQLREVVQTLAEPLRNRVVGRFQEANQLLLDAGLLDAVDRVSELSPTEFVSLAARFMAMRVDCPFLENEQCAIYDDRPLACREYAVTSPAEHCWNPTPETLRRVPLPMSLCSSLSRPVKEDLARCEFPVPLIRLLAKERTPNPELRTGTEWLRQILGRIQET